MYKNYDYKGFRYHTIKIEINIQLPGRSLNITLNILHVLNRRVEVGWYLKLNGLQFRRITNAVIPTLTQKQFNRYINWLVRS